MFRPSLLKRGRLENVADLGRIKQFGPRECDLIQFGKKFGRANVTSLVERVRRSAIFLRNNDRQSALRGEILRSRESMES
jgi:IS30 family transposase